MGARAGLPLLPQRSRHGALGARMRLEGSIQPPPRASPSAPTPTGGARAASPHAAHPPSHTPRPRSLCVCLCEGLRLPAPPLPPRFLRGTWRGNEALSEGELRRERESASRLTPPGSPPQHHHQMRWRRWEGSWGSFPSSLVCVKAKAGRGASLRLYRSLPSSPPSLRRAIPRISAPPQIHPHVSSPAHST